MKPKNAESDGYDDDSHNAYDDLSPYPKLRIYECSNDKLRSNISTNWKTFPSCSKSQNGTIR